MNDILPSLEKVKNGPWTPKTVESPIIGEENERGNKSREISLQNSGVSRELVMDTANRRESPMGQTPSGTIFPSCPGEDSPAHREKNGQGPGNWKASRRLAEKIIFTEPPERG